MLIWLQYQSSAVFTVTLAHLWSIIYPPLPQKGIQGLKKKKNGGNRGRVPREKMRGEKQWSVVWTVVGHNREGGVG